MNTQRKAECIYVALAFFTAIGQLTWVQIAYNDPSTLNAMTLRSFGILAGISSVFVLTQTLIAWKAFLHNPTAEPPSLSPTETKPTEIKP